MVNMEPVSVWNNKKYVISIIVYALLSFGFQLTHASLGADDIFIYEYFYGGMGVIIGRWPFFVLSRCIGIDGLSRFIPFSTDLFAVVLLIIAAMIWTEYIRRVLSMFDVEINIFPYIVFSGMFIGYSLITQVWIYYLHNGIVLGYVLIGLSLIKYIDLINKRLHKKLESENCFKALIEVLILVVFVCLAISFYESMVSVFLVGISFYLLVAVY